MREHAAERVEVEEARAPGEGARRRGVRGKRARPAACSRSPAQTQLRELAKHIEMGSQADTYLSSGAPLRRPNASFSYIQSPGGRAGTEALMPLPPATILLREKGFLISSVHTPA